MVVIPNEILRAQLASGRLSHAYIFDAKDPAKAKEVALAFAEALLDPNSRGLDPSASGDLMMVSPAGKVIPIDQIREIKRYFLSRPIRGDYKLVIIEQAEKMQQEASNALLKTLEEMPRYGKLILLIQGAEKLLPTIRSRCQILRIQGESEAIDELDEDEVLDFMDRLLMGDLLVLYEKRKWLDEVKSKAGNFYLHVLNYLAEIHFSVTTGRITSPRIEHLTEGRRIDQRALEHGIEVAARIEAHLPVNINFLLSTEELALQLQGIIRKS